MRTSMTWKLLSTYLIRIERVDVTVIDEYVSNCIFSHSFPSEHRKHLKNVMAPLLLDFGYYYIVITYFETVDRKLTRPNSFMYIIYLRCCRVPLRAYNIQHNISMVTVDIPTSSHSHTHTWMRAQQHLQTSTTETLSACQWYESTEPSSIFRAEPIWRSIPMNDCRTKTANHIGTISVFDLEGLPVQILIKLMLSVAKNSMCTSLCTITSSRWTF
jgi:hypothetical protein